VDIELQRAGIPILGGRLDGRLWIAGHEVSSRTPWQNICSEVNDEAAYIELQRDLEGGFQIDRQIFLARRDEFAYLADVVRGPRDSVGEYRWRIPLAPQTQWCPAAESHEGQIRAGRRNVASVIPLSLPEWRSEPGGQLDASPNQLLMNVPFRHRTHAALFLDLSPRRFRRPVTWRRLTVGESLAAVPRDVASGYRVQIG
jgi:hypothetical protein